MNIFLEKFKEIFQRNLKSNYKIIFTNFLLFNIFVLFVIVYLQFFFEQLIIDF